MSRDRPSAIFARSFSEMPMSMTGRAASFDPIAALLDPVGQHEPVRFRSSNQEFLCRRLGETGDRPRFPKPGTDHDFPGNRGLSPVFSVVLADPRGVGGLLELR